MCLKVSTCCGCVSLETASTVVAIVGLISALIRLISNIGMIGSGAFLVVVNVEAAVALILSACLLYGASKKKPAFVLVWLIFEMLEIILFVMLAILVFAGAVAIEGDAETDVAVKTFVWIYSVSFLIGSAFAIYLWIVVHSFYKSLEGGRGTPQMV